MDNEPEDEPEVEAPAEEVIPDAPEPVAEEAPQEVAREAPAPVYIHSRGRPPRIKPRRLPRVVGLFTITS